MMNKTVTVDEYIANAPVAFQDKLKQLRALIKRIVPDAAEKISYGMPFYDYKGRLVYFAYQKNHIGLYIPPPIIEKHQKELSQYHTSKSAIQFPLDKELPVELIQKLIQGRVTWNDEAKKK